MNGNGNGNGSAQVGTIRVKQGLAQMLKGGVIVSMLLITFSSHRFSHTIHLGEKSGS